MRNKSTLFLNFELFTERFLNFLTNFKNRVSKI